jgi:FixJ family two-component response regulator
MMDEANSRYKDDVIASEAVTWLDRLADLRPAERAEFLEWIRRSARHYLAFWYLQSVSGKTGDAPTREPDILQRWLADAMDPKTRPPEFNLEPPVVCIIDDDPEVQRALTRLLGAAGHGTRSFGSAKEFLVAGGDRLPAGCIISEAVMPDLDGLELQQRLIASGSQHPIIFLTRHRDIAKAVRAMKAGAVNFLTKPVDGRELLAAVEEALRIDAAQRGLQSTRTSVAERLSTLTRRERQVFEKVVAGRLNKQIAAELGTVEKTIKVHRARVMQKMHANSLIELVHLATHAGIDMIDRAAECKQALPAPASPGRETLISRAVWVTSDPPVLAIKAVSLNH